MKIIFHIFSISFLIYVTFQIQILPLAETSVHTNKSVITKQTVKKAVFFDRYTFYQSQRVPINSTELLRMIDLAREKARINNEMRLEEERREKIFRDYLASRIQSSFIRDFLTQRY
jgi:hypothetical protein